LELTVSIEFIEYVKLLVTFPILLVLSIQDYKSRELDARLVYIYLVVSIVMFVLTSVFSDLVLTLKLFYVFFSIGVVGIVFYTLYRLGLIGDGDVFVAVSLGLMYTYPTTYSATLASRGILPPPIMIILYSTLGAILLIIVNSIYVVLTSYKFVQDLPGVYRILLPLFGKPVKISDYIQGKYKHYIPLQSFELVGGNLVVKYRVLTGIDYDIRSTLKQLVEEKFIDPEGYIWVSPGLPFIVYFFAGFILFLILGDKPLLTLFFKVLF